MSFESDLSPRIYLNDGITNTDLPGCSIVYPFRELTPLIALQEKYDLEHLVHWALSHGYGASSIGLTVTWTRDEIQRRLGCRISDDLLQAAQEWLDRTSGGLAAATAYHLWEDVLAQLRSEFAAYVANAEDRWNGPVDSDGAEDILGDHTSDDSSSIGAIAAAECVTQTPAGASTHDYEVKFLVRAHVSTECPDLGETASRVHCSAKAFVDPGDPLIELEDVEVQWLEANERNEDGWIVRTIDTAGERPSD